MLVVYYRRGERLSRHQGGIPEIVDRKSNGSNLPLVSGVAHSGRGGLMLHDGAGSAVPDLTMFSIPTKPSRRAHHNKPSITES